MSRVLTAATVIGIVVATLLTLAGPAQAHERRTVGPYLFVVGWLSEPAFEGQPNAASVRVTDPRETPAKAVEGLEKTLRIEVFQGGLAPYSGAPRAVFGQPGLYALDMYPTVSGAYRYRITGTIGTLTVNETFESGPTTFNDVQPASALQYPTKVPTGDALAAELAAAKDAANAARLIAIAAVAAAVVAIALALATARRRSA